MKQFIRVACGCLGALWLAGGSVLGATILQGSGATHVAFEAEENVTILTGTPTSFVITNDATPAGDRALFASGVNNTTAPSSFASYSIKFSTPGSYKLYFNWRAHQAYTALDPNTGNSFYTPKFFNTSTTPVDPNPDYNIASVNNTRVAPASNVYGIGTETTLLEVTQEQVDAGEPLQFTLGTREAGMLFDRIVLTSQPTLSDAEFNALPNSDTSVFVQPPGANYVAFEAESAKGTITPGSPTSFVLTNDVTPSGDLALFASGVNNTTAPSSFASYSIKFSTPGSYKLYFNWRAHQAYTALDPNTGNSFYTPKFFNTSTTPVDPNPDYNIASVNNTRVAPASNVYGIGTETTLLEVTQEQVDAGEPLQFTLGTREAGMLFDRIVFSLQLTLTDAEFNALENTGTSVPPAVTKTIGSGSLESVKITFSKALDESSVVQGNFTLSGGIAVLAAALDPVTLKSVTLTTAPQVENTSYTVTINNVKDLGGSSINPNTAATFQSWKAAPGFAFREIYFAIAGTDVNSLVSDPKYPAGSDQVDVVQGLASINNPRQPNYGVRLTGFFVPAQAGIYDFFMYANDEAQLFLSDSASEAGLQLILTAPATDVLEFDPAVTAATPSLVAGKRYAIRVLQKQGNEFDSFVNVAARRQGDATPVSELKTLGGAELVAYVDPTRTSINISTQPANATVIEGRRARFEVSASSPGGPIFYQWQVNGIDIPGATRAAVYTPVTAIADSGKKYRCVVSGGGVSATSLEAVLTVTSGNPPNTQPFIGISFVGGFAGAGPGASLRANDVVGIVPQANFNNLPGTTGTDVALVDADGASSDVLATYTGATYFTGTGERTAEDVLFQGYLHNANGTVNITLGAVPAGHYQLIVYSVGFNYNAIYDSRYELTGAESYPTFYVRAEHAADYSTAPSVFRRMSSTNPDARDQGNYLIFEDVQPDGGGQLMLAVSNESTATATTINVSPAVSGLQLVRVSASLPALSIASAPPGKVKITWGADAAAYTLESSASLDSGAVWKAVAGTPNPLVGAGSTEAATSEKAQFYRLRR